MRPHDPSILCTYADFLFYHHDNFKDSESFYLSSIKTLQPFLFSCNNYACLLLKKAESLIPAPDESSPPPDPINTKKAKKEKKKLVRNAEVYFKKATELESSKYPIHFRNYATFLRTYSAELYKNSGDLQKHSELVDELLRQAKVIGERQRRETKREQREERRV